MPSSENQLLSILSKDDFALLEPHLEPVTLGLRKYLEWPNKQITAVYFPEGGFASVVAIQSRGKRVEVGLIGREGMTGLPVVLGNHRSPNATYMQMSGTGKCMSAAALRDAFRVSGSLRELVVEVRAGVRGANDEHRDLQRTVQTGRATGALALDGPRPGGRRYAAAHPRVPLAHARCPPARGNGSAACAAKKKADFLCAREITVEDRKGLERAAGEPMAVRRPISPADPLKGFE